LRTKPLNLLITFGNDGSLSSCTQVGYIPDGYTMPSKGE
jgi:hypothetical protein